MKALNSERRILLNPKERNKERNEKGAKASVRDNPELDFGILDRGVGKQSYIPDASFYWSGIQRGSEKANDDVRKFVKATGVFDAHSQVTKEFLRIDPKKKPTDAEVKNAIDNLQAKARYLEHQGDVLEPGNGSASAWAFVFNTPVLSPKRVNSRFELVKAPIPEKLRSLGLNSLTLTPKADTHTPTAKELKEYLGKLDADWFLETNTKGEFLINSGRIVGMSLAFMNLNVMRSNPKYVEAMKDAETATKYLKDATSQANLLSPRLSLLDSNKDLLGSDFLMASISSGYHDLPSQISNDRAAIAYEEGFQQGKAEALDIIKKGLGVQIPGLAKAESIPDAAAIISGHVMAQQAEINKLKDIIGDLEKIVKNLGEALDNANKLIESLKKTNESLQRDLDTANETLKKLGRTSDSISRLANAGAGFLVAGPIGSVVCMIFCYAEPEPHPLWRRVFTC